MNRTHFFRLAGIAVLVAIWVLSLMPGNSLVIPGSDKLHHALAYCACMFCWGQLNWSPGSRLKLAIAFILMGVVIECLQYLTPTRTFDALDMVANAIGTIVGWSIVTVQLSVERNWHRRNSASSVAK